MLKELEMKVKRQTLQETFVVVDNYDNLVMIIKTNNLF